MGIERCPSCTAAVRPDAPWCTQCYTDLRTKPVAGGSTGRSGHDVDPLTAPLSLVTAVVVAPQPLIEVAPEPVPAAEQARPKTPGWPCACGAVVPIELDLCNICARPFMGGVKEDALLELPGVGLLPKLEGPGRAAVIVGGMVAMTLLFFVVAWLVGHLV